MYGQFMYRVVAQRKESDDWLYAYCKDCRFFSATDNYCSRCRMITAPYKRCKSYKGVTE